MIIIEQRNITTSAINIKKTASVQFVLNMKSTTTLFHIYYKHSSRERERKKKQKQMTNII